MTCIISDPTLGGQCQTWIQVPGIEIPDQVRLEIGSFQQAKLTVLGHETGDPHGNMDQVRLETNWTLAVNYMDKKEKY